MPRPTNASMSRLYFPVVVLIIVSVSLISSVWGLSLFEEELRSGHQRIAERVHRYEVIHVDTSHHLRQVRRRRATGERSYNHPQESDFDVAAFGKRFRLKLRLNNVLIPSNFELQTFDSNGKMLVDRDVVHCYYQGEVQGLPETSSHAVISTCNGIGGVFGVGPAGHWTDEQTFFIEPLTAQPSANGTHLHAIFRGRDRKKNLGKLGTCGIRHQHSQAIAENATRKFMDDMGSMKFSETHNRVRRQAGSAKKWGFPTLRRQAAPERNVELMLVMDNALFAAHGRKSGTLASRAISVANFMDQVYTPLGIRIPLVAVRIFTNGDEFTTTTNVNNMLTNFLNYRRDSINPTVSQDNAQLMTGLNFDGSKTGIAPVSGMCSSARSGGANQDTSSDFLSLAATMAHNIGHNLGMGHDTLSRGCSCTAPSSQGGCIMAATASFITPRVWSSCSVSDLNAFISQGLGSCLDNKPPQLFGKPVCGNRLVEAGEECDCGTLAECENRCCDATTCRLTTGSQCIDGPCCQNCSFRSAGTQCRAAANSCDVPEACTGLSHTCPDNIFVQNGQTCGSGSTASFCYNGACDTHDAQCKRTWGSTAVVAPHSCFQLNRETHSGRGCGIHPASGRPMPCATVDVRCGRLYCISSRQFTRLVTPQISYKNFIGSITCRSATGQDANFGLVNDGIKCAANSLCVKQQCRPVTALRNTPCPVRNGRVCSGNGVCTSLNTCLCNRGFTLADCSRSTQPINGQWSPWTTWSGCSETCGTQGTRSRRRNCDNPPPSKGGATCSGASNERSTCNRVVCQVPGNGGWATWGRWISCSRTCGSGLRFRARGCTNPWPSTGGADCSGSRVQVGTCNTQACPT